MRKLSISFLVIVLSLMIGGYAFSQDADGDSVPDEDDNCLSMPNGAELGTCVTLIGGIFKGTGLTCTDSIECGLNDLCDLEQLDFNGNGIGDACECHGAFDNDNDIDGTDAAIFKMGFGRSSFNNPCPASIGIPCPEGLIDCDDRCVDPMRDREYCGASEECIDGTVCGAGEICVSGTCVITCPSTLTECSGECVDTNTDESYCGSCTNSCEVDEMCVTGNCETWFSVNYAPVPKTGQTRAWATGDDGDIEKGVAWPNPRFIDNGDGTVTDNLTGLVWLKNANCFGIRTWNEALSDCNGLSSGLCGLTDGSSAGDWRLPNYKELFSLIDADKYEPALTSGLPFNNVQSVNYWSSTTLACCGGNAWGVHMDWGKVDNIGKTASVYVWPVRDAQ